MHNLKSIKHTQFKNNIQTDSNLDLIFSSVNLADKLNVKVNDETWRSDHYPIFIDVYLEKSIYRKKSFNLKSIRTDWEKVDENLNENYIKFLNTKFDSMPACDKYTIFMEIISNAIIASTPKKKK